MKKYSIYSLLLLLLCLISFKTSAQANELTFSVTPIIPTNQINQKVGYFDLLLKKNATQTVIVKLKNTSNKSIVIKTNIKAAKTNTNGVVDYNNTKIKPDSTLKNNIEGLVEVPATTYLKSGEEKSLPITIRLPANELDGVVAGGINFKDVSNQTKGDKPNTKGMAINNTYSFQLGLLMRTNQKKINDDQRVKDGLKLINVRPNQRNFRNVIDVNFQNPLPAYLNQLTVNAKICKKGRRKIIYARNVSLMQMAPNSNFDYSILLGNGQKMIPGKYTVIVDAYSTLNQFGRYSVKNEQAVTQRYQYHWHFKKDFVITAPQAHKFNQSDVTIKATNWIGWLISFGSLLLLLILGLIVFKKRKDKIVNVMQITLENNGQHKTSFQKMTVREYQKLKRQGLMVIIVEH